MGEVAGKLSQKSGRKKAHYEGFPLVDIPNDVLGEVLKWVPTTDIISSCVYVCRQWRDVIYTQTFWKDKCVRDYGYSENILHILKIEDFKMFFFQNPYQRNLIQNPDGSEGQHHWKILSNGGSGWQVEEPIGCNPVEQYTRDSQTKRTSCWAASYGECSKVQVIDLLDRGCSAYVLDNVRPDICVSEWYAARFDCGIKYKITVQLLGQKTDKVPVTEWTFEDRKPAGRDWFNTGFTFSNYEPGVRYVRYYHEGTDTQFWAGWYGAKITLSSVMLDLTHTARPAQSS